MNESAYICGNVRIGRYCSIWPQVVIRGDIAPITIGDRVNIQDGVVIHTKHGVPLEIGHDVSFGHRAVVHCRRIGHGTLVGIGSILLDDCEIGARCLIAAGAVLTPETRIPDGQLVMGLPAKVVRALTPEDYSYFDHVTLNYRELAKRHHRGDFPRSQISENRL